MMFNASLPNPEPRASTSSQVPRQALATTASSSPAVRTSSSRTSTPTSSSNSRIQIFVDPSGSEAEAAEANHTANAWEDLGTRKTRIKENVPEVKKLVGTTLKQAGRSKRIASNSGSGFGVTTSGSGSKIVPFRDPPVLPAGDISMPPPPVPTKKVGETGPRGFIPFADQAPESAAGVVVPGTPMFTPFRDEVSGLFFRGRSVS